MYLILTASKDTYITDKIIDNKFRAKDANVGRAGTIDLFKLYDESSISGSSKPIELSRALIKFNLNPIQELTGSSIDITSSNFQVRLKIFNVLGGQATPSDFNLLLYPLSQSFDEGIGRDVASFSDLDACNFVTSSYSDGSAILWNISGSNSGGLLGSSDIDFITSGNLGSGVVDLGTSQNFIVGNEDLDMDVTTVVSGTLVDLIPNHGFRICYSGSEETDSKTRFVKRFASRHASNQFLVPQLHVSWDDSTTDHHRGFLFNVSGSLFLNNFERGAPANLTSGSANTAVSGDDSLILKLQRGEWIKYITGSQHTAGTGGSAVTGVYSASFALDMFSADAINDSGETLLSVLNKSGSVVFQEYWTSIDGTVGYYTGSLEVKKPQRTSYSSNPVDLLFNFINLNESYRKDDVVKIRIFVDDLNAEEKVYKRPYKIKSIILSQMFYRVRNADTGTIVIPFESIKDGTKISSDSEGMYFNFRMESLPRGHSYRFDLLVKDFDLNKIYESVSGKFRVT